MSDGLENVGCYMCGNKKATPVGSKEGLSIVRCNDCALLYVSPRIPERRLAELYDSSYWFERMQVHGYASILERVTWDYWDAFDRIREIREFRTQGRFLDIGCSNGALVLRASQEGFCAFGYELDQFIAMIAGRISGRPVFTSDPLLLEEGESLDGGWDVISMYDVFEHFYNPRRELSRVRRVLRQKGLIVLETFRTDPPSFSEDPIKHEDTKPAEHIYMYQERHLEELFVAARFRILSRRYPAGPGHSRIRYYLEPA